MTTGLPSCGTATQGKLPTQRWAARLSLLGAQAYGRPAISRIQLTERDQIIRFMPRPNAMAYGQERASLSEWRGKQGG